jgi:hypothetical protein|tara:strand:- start:2947 stop:3174 length:228 start_codon:yes stop_codon:yes gene_type:complete
MELDDKHIAKLKNDQKRIDDNLNRQKNKFIDEIRSGLGQDIKERINNPKEEIKEEEQTEGLFRTLKKWILKTSKK